MGKSGNGEQIIDSLKDLELQFSALQASLLDGRLGKKDISQAFSMLEELSKIIKKKLKRVSSDVVKAIKNTEVLKELREIPIQLESQKVQLSKVLQKITSLPELGIQTSKGAILLWNPIFKQLELVASEGLDAEILDHCSSIERGNCFCGKTIESMALGIFKKDKDHIPFCSAGKNNDSTVCIPITGGSGEALGVLTLFLENGKTEEDLDMNLIEVAIEGIETTIRSHRERIIELLKDVREIDFDVDSFEKINKVSDLLSHMCPNPEAVFMGFSEILINAFEHGVLGITCEEKSKLRSTRGKDAWKERVDELSVAAIKDGKYFRVHAKKYADRLIVNINDYGKGFDPSKFRELNMDLLKNGHGMGIVQSKEVFDEIKYNEIGNEVTLTIMLEKNDKYPVCLNKIDRKANNLYEN